MKKINVFYKLSWEEKKNKGKINLFFFVANRNTTCHTYISFLDTPNPPKLRLFHSELCHFQNFVMKKMVLNIWYGNSLFFSTLVVFPFWGMFFFFISIEKLYKNWSDKFFLKYLSNSWKLPAVCVLPWNFFCVFFQKTNN